MGRLAPNSCGTGPRSAVDFFRLQCGVRRVDLAVCSKHAVPHRLHWGACRLRFSCVVATEVCEEALLASHSCLDRRATAVVLRLVVGSEAVAVGRRRPWFNRDALQLPEVQEQVWHLWQCIPQFPSEFGADVNRSEALLAKLSRVAIAEVAPVGLAAARADWMTSRT